MILDELLVKLGFDYNPTDINKFREDVGKTANMVQKFAQLASLAATAITGLTVASTQASDEQGKLANEIGETVEKISALEFANKRAGNSAEEMGSSLRDLSIRASEAARGLGSGVEAFGLLGISATNSNGQVKQTSDLMIEISGALQNLTNAKQIELADKLGLRGSLRLLQQGPSAIRELTQEAQALGVTTAKDAAIAEQFQDGLVGLWTIVKDLSRTLTRSFAPILKENIELFTQWWKQNRDIINQKLPEWIDNLTRIVKLLTIAFGAFIGLRLITHFVALVNVMKTLTLATLAANAAAFLLPALLFTVGAAFLAILDDAKVFWEGGESFIGSMLEKYPKWTEEINVVASIFGAINKVTMTILDGWKQIFNLFSSSTLNDTIEVLKNIPGFAFDATGLARQDGTGFIPDLTNTVQQSGATLVDKVEIIVQGGIDSAENIAQSVFNIFQQTSQDLNSAVEQ